jgi:hypothetical protein
MSRRIAYRDRNTVRGEKAVKSRSTGVKFCQRVEREWGSGSTRISVRRIDSLRRLTDHGRGAHGTAGKMPALRDGGLTILYCELFFAGAQLGLIWNESW